MKRPLSKKQIGIRWSWVNMGEPWFYSTAFWRSFRSCEIAMNFAWTYTPVHQSTNTLILLIDSLANLQLADQMDGAWQFVEKTVSMHDMITNWLELHILYIYIYSNTTCTDISDILYNCSSHVYIVLFAKWLYQDQNCSLFHVLLLSHKPQLLSDGCLYFKSTTLHRLLALCWY